MLDHAMPDAWFDAALWVHIISGTIAAVIVFPFMIFGPKDKRHRKVGTIAVRITWVIVGSGALLLLDPLFLVYWQQLAVSISTMRHDYVHVFQDAQEAWLFFVYLDVLLAYLVFTGVGVWSRLRRGNRREGFPLRPFDVILTLVAIALTLNMIVVGVLTWSENSGYASILVISGSLMCIVFAFDLRTWLDKGRKVRSWWALHAWKLSVAWAALVYAVFLRWRAKSELLESLTGLVALIVILAILIALGLYSARLHRHGRLARLLSHLPHQEDRA